MNPGDFFILAPRHTRTWTVSDGRRWRRATRQPRLLPRRQGSDSYYLLLLYLYRPRQSRGFRCRAAPSLSGHGPRSRLSPQKESCWQLKRAVGLSPPHTSLVPGLFKASPRRPPHFSKLTEQSSHPSSQNIYARARCLAKVVEHLQPPDAGSGIAFFWLEIIGRILN
jgi:hypothetical protein